MYYYVVPRPTLLTSIQFLLENFVRKRTQGLFPSLWSFPQEPHLYYAERLKEREVGERERKEEESEGRRRRRMRDRNREIEGGRGRATYRSARSKNHKNKESGLGEIEICDRRLPTTHLLGSRRFKLFLLPLRFLHGHYNGRRLLDLSLLFLLLLNRLNLLNLLCSLSNSEKCKNDNVVFEERSLFGKMKSKK